MTSKEEQIREMYHDKGMSQSKIGEHFGVDQTTVSLWMKKYGIPNRWRNEGYHDEETLKRLYSEQGMTMEEIAEKYDTTKKTISRWINNFNIPVRSRRTPWASYYVDPNGYPKWSTKARDGPRRTVAVHQLLAIADGKDPHKVFSGGEWHVHHRNGIEWDNRPENLALMTREEHTIYHVMQCTSYPSELQPRVV